MTEEQRQDLDRLRRYIERERLSSCMNNTKWSRLVEVLHAATGFRPCFRARLVRDHRDPIAWEHSFPWHLPTYEFIEWLEIKPIIRRDRGHLLEPAAQDFTDELTAALESARIPFTIEAGVIRVWAYLRPGASPPFV